MHSFSNLDSLLEFGSEYLCSHSISNYIQESSWILLHTINKNSTWLYSHRDYCPTDVEIENYLKPPQT